MKPNFDWLLKQRLSQVEKKDFTWIFSFEAGGSVNTQSMWRLVTPSGIFVTSEDHEQLFGLPAPVDAGKRVMDTIQNKRISSYSCERPCSDLMISFEGGAQIQFLSTSCGYESWEMWNGTTQIICTGGGELAEF
jgi:hypothetical protein